jgi:hypothetical protein
MSYRSVMVIKAAVCLVFGIILISLPSALFGLLGASLSPGGAFAAREYAAALFGNLMLTWLARNAAASAARRAIIIALFVYDAIGVLVSLFAVLSGILNPLGWLIVAVYLFFTLAFGYLLSEKKATS